MEYWKNKSFENLTGYDPDGNFHVEKWENMPNCNKSYFVSTFGRLKVVGLKINHYLSHTGYAIRKDRIIQGSFTKKGYRCVCIEGKTHGVHQLVAITFIPNPENKPMPNHIDLVKTNNCVWNLEWSTNRENSTHHRLTLKTSSQYTGVSWDKKREKWGAYITYNKKHIFLGYFAEEIDAHNAYQKALSEINNGIFIIPKRKKLSQYVGISFHKKDNLWTAHIKKIYVGAYKTELEAYNAQQEKMQNK